MDLQSEVKSILKKINSIERRLNTLGGGAGQANTASNIGVGGVGLYKQKVGVDLQFRKVNAGSAIVTVVLDAPNNEVDIDVDPSQIEINDLGDVNAGAPANDDVLTWNVATNRWIAQVGGAGGGAVNPFAFRRSGRCYTTWDYYTSTTMIPVRDTLYAYPFIVPVSQSFDRMIIEVTTARTNGEARIGIYEDDGSIYPGDLVVASAAIDCTANGFKPQVIAETLTAGLYWLVINHDGDSAVGFRAIDYDHTSPIGYYSILGHDEDNFLTNPDIFWQVAEVYGALPDPFPGGASRTNNNNMVCIMLRAA